MFEKTGILPTFRPQDLTVKQWCQLAKTYEEFLKSNEEAMQEFKQKTEKSGRDAYALASRILADLENKRL